MSRRQSVVKKIHSFFRPLLTFAARSFCFLQPRFIHPTRPVLMEIAYTVANDTPEAGRSRLMAVMLAMSEVRSQFDGDVVIFRTGEVPGFQSGAAMAQLGSSRNAVIVTPASSAKR